MSSLSTPPLTTTVGLRWRCKTTHRLADYGSGRRGGRTAALAELSEDSFGVNKLPFPSSFPPTPSSKSNRLKHGCSTLKVRRSHLDVTRDVTSTGALRWSRCWRYKQSPMRDVAQTARVSVPTCDTLRAVHDH